MKQPFLLWHFIIFILLKTAAGYFFTLITADAISFMHLIDDMYYTGFHSW